MKNEPFVLTCCKTVICVYAEELLQNLPISLLATCIRRGKGYRRGIAVEKREKTNLTPWTDEREDEP
jgi:hypothetical protein